MTVNFNDAQTEENHQGARDFVFWNLPQVSIVLKLVYLFIIDLSCFLSLSHNFFTHIVEFYTLFKYSAHLPSTHVMIFLLFLYMSSITELSIFKISNFIHS